MIRYFNEFKNFNYFPILSLFAAIVGFLKLFLLSYTLTVVEFGNLAFVYFTAAFAGFIINSTTNEGLLIYCSKFNKKINYELIGKIFSSVFCLNITVSAVICFILEVAYNYKPTEILQYASTSVMLAIGLYAFNLNVCLLRIKKKLNLYGSMLLVRQILSILYISLVPSYNYIEIICAEYLLNLSLSLPLIFKGPLALVSVKNCKFLYKKVYKNGVHPFMGSFFKFLNNNIDKGFAVLYLTKTEYGYYSFCSIFTNVAVMLATILNTKSIPFYVASRIRNTTFRRYLILKRSKISLSILFSVIPITLLAYNGLQYVAPYVNLSKYMHLGLEISFFILISGLILYTLTLEIIHYLYKREDLLMKSPLIILMLTIFLYSIGLTFDLNFIQFILCILLTRIIYSVVTTIYVFMNYKKMKK